MKFIRINSPTLTTTSFNQPIGLLMNIEDYNQNPWKIEFISPSSLPKWARSDILNLSFQLATPRDSFFWISSNNSGKFTTQPLPKHKTKSRLFVLPSEFISQRYSLTDYINTIFEMKTRWKHMKIVFSSIDNNTMTCIVSSLISIIQIRSTSKSVRFTWHRQTMSASEASRSTSLPLP